MYFLLVCRLFQLKSDARKYQNNLALNKQNLFRNGKPFRRTTSFLRHDVNEHNSNNTIQIRSLIGSCTVCTLESAATRYITLLQRSPSQLHLQYQNHSMAYLTMSTYKEEPKDRDVSGRVLI